VDRSSYFNSEGDFQEVEQAEFEVSEKSAEPTEHSTTMVMSDLLEGQSYHDRICHNEVARSGFTTGRL